MQWNLLLPSSAHPGLVSSPSGLSQLRLVDVVGTSARFTPYQSPTCGGRARAEPDKADTHLRPAATPAAPPCGVVLSWSRGTGSGPEGTRCSLLPLLEPNQQSDRGNYIFFWGNLKPYAFAYSSQSSITLRWTVRRIIIVLALIASSSVMGSSPTTTGGEVVIFLHNAFFEKNKDGQAHKRFGPYDFEGIKAALRKDRTLIAPERGPDADPQQAADALVANVKEMIESGRSADRIKVIGASKGAFIAQLASAKLEEPEMRWVLVGGCHTKRMSKGGFPAMTGRVLSIYDSSDQIAGPCAPYKPLTAKTSSFEEISISLGEGHGFQFSGNSAWITPALDW